ncbi:hypothetical protein ACT7DH_06845 [Bacillus pacificus]
MDNIRYGRLDASDEEVINAAKAASAHSFMEHLPNQYETKIASEGSNLSQGTKTTSCDCTGNFSRCRYINSRRSNI